MARISYRVLEVYSDGRIRYEDQSGCQGTAKDWDEYYDIINADVD